MLEFVKKEPVVVIAWLLVAAFAVAGFISQFGCATANAIPPEGVKVPSNVSEGPDLTQCLQPPQDLYGAQLTTCEVIAGSDSMCCIYSIKITPPEDMKQYGPYKCRFFICKAGCMDPWMLVGARCMGIHEDEDFGVEK